MVAVGVGVARGHDDLVGDQVALLRQHMGKQRQGSGVVRQAEEHVGAADVQLHRQVTVMHKRLVQQVARRQGLLAVACVFLGALGFVGQVLDVPAVEQDAAAVGVGLQGLEKLA